MIGEPVAGSYYDPKEERRYRLMIRKEMNGLAGWRNSYIIDFGYFVGIGCYRDISKWWAVWEPYTGQPDRLEQLDVARHAALAQTMIVPGPRKSLWRWW